MYQVLLPPCGRAITTQSVACTGASLAAGATFSAQTRVVRLSANTACFYQIGDGAQTASTATPYLGAHTIEYVRVNPGQSAAGIRATTAGLDTATSGTLWITELTA